MATKKPAAKNGRNTSSSKETHVTRIKASSDAPKQVEKKASTKEAAVKTKGKKAAQKDTDSVGYFRGAWQELRQVHWPTRKATWALTGAVLVFSGLFVLLIVLLDAGFQLLFERIIG